MRLENNDTVSAFDAKTHLSQLLGQVQLGHRFTITKHNTPIAILMPISRGKQPVHDVVELIFLARKKSKLGGLSIKELMEEGRR